MGMDGPGRASPSTRARILLVEDDADLRESLCRVLEDAGYEVDGVRNGQEALEYLRPHTTAFSDAYVRKAKAVLKPGTVAAYRALADTSPGYVLIDAAQLLKHALGLATQTVRRRSPSPAPA